MDDYLNQDSDSAFRFFDSALTAWLQHDSNKLQSQQPVAYGGNYPYTANTQPVQQGISVNMVLLLAGAAMLIFFAAKD